jgi:hypothetical protein
LEVVTSIPEKNSSATKAIGKENVEWVSLRVSILYEKRKNEEHKSKREREWGPFGQAKRILRQEETKVSR